MKGIRYKEQGTRNKQQGATNMKQVNKNADNKRNIKKGPGTGDQE